MNGLLLRHLDVDLALTGLAASNMTESIMALAHLMNAAQVTGDLKTSWPDMERVVALCDENRMFLGQHYATDAPDSTDLMCHRFPTYRANVLS